MFTYILNIIVIFYFFCGLMGCRAFLELPQAVKEDVELRKAEKVKFYTQTLSAQHVMPFVVQLRDVLFHTYLQCCSVMFQY